MGIETQPRREFRSDSLKSAGHGFASSGILVVLVGCFALGFQLLFYSTPLYNSAAKPEERIERWNLLSIAFSSSTPEAPNWWTLTSERLSHVGNLPQRLPMLAFAVAVWIVAVAAGHAFRLLVCCVRVANWLEAVLMDFGLGMGLLSLAVQGLGLGGWCSRASLVGLACVAGVAAWVGRFVGSSRPADVDSVADASGNEVAMDPASNWLRGFVLVVGGVFALLALLAAMLPTTDYDALGYHLLGPKEWFQRGRIEQLPHNVYTTFPFLTEMFAYAGMVALGDWTTGGIAGQTTLWIFGPATAAAVGVLAARGFGARAGWIAGLIYVSTPWTYRLSSIPYVEGAMNFYAVVALLAALRAGASPRWSFIAGSLAGCAASCKYPGLVFVAAPTLAACIGLGWRKLDTVPAFLIGLAVFFGPWLVRNYQWTGNPTFPLLSQHFKTRNWPPEKASRFEAAHRSKSFAIADAVEHASIVAWKSDWQTPLAFAFAPLALLSRRRSTALWLWILTLTLFGVFWGLTHRLDRFFLTLEPPAIALAAGGMTWSIRPAWRWLAMGCLLLSIPYHLVYCTCGLCGLPNYTADLKSQWRSNWKLETAVKCANDTRLVPPAAPVYFIGYAGVYDCIPPSIYSTVFDDNMLEQIAHNPDADAPDALKPGFRIKAAFDELRIDYVIVDWTWIKRYREPGNYGFSNFIQPPVFRKLCDLGIFEKVALPPDYPQDGSIELYRVLRAKLDAASAQPRVSL